MVNIQEIEPEIASPPQQKPTTLKVNFPYWGTELLAWIPSLIGVLFRRLLYPYFFANFGNRNHIQWGVHFKFPRQIEIHDRVRFHEGISVYSMHPLSKVIFHSRACIGSGTHINNRGEKSKVFIGKNVRLDRLINLKVHESGCTYIGDNTYVGPYTCISGIGDIKIGKDCLIASHCSIYAHNYRFDNRALNIGEQGKTSIGVIIEDNCWLGSGVRVVDGVKIGYGSVIGAGAVVTSDIPPNSVAVGVPAKVISKRE